MKSLTIFTTLIFNLLSSTFNAQNEVHSISQKGENANVIFIDISSSNKLNLGGKYTGEIKIAGNFETNTINPLFLIPSSSTITQIKSSEFVALWIGYQTELSMLNENEFSLLSPNLQVQYLNNGTFIYKGLQPTVAEIVAFSQH
jgi:hypothetical protein